MKLVAGEIVYVLFVDAWLLLLIKQFQKQVEWGGRDAISAPDGSGLGRVG
jgi:hypothetical protein